MVAGAAPPASMIEGMEKMGFDLTRVYGLTEVYGPATRVRQTRGLEALWTWRRARLNARQGVRYHLQRDARVLDPGDHAARAVGRRNHGRDHVRQHRHEGLPEEPQGDRGLCGRLVPQRRPGGAVPRRLHQDQDRSKDIIISGGENISSIEVEDVLYRHPTCWPPPWWPSPTPKWGETPAPLWS